MMIFGAKLALWTLLPNERENKVEIGSCSWFAYFHNCNICHWVLWINDQKVALEQDRKQIILQAQNFKAQQKCWKSVPYHRVRISCWISCEDGCRILELGFVFNFLSEIPVPLVTPCNPLFLIQGQRGFVAYIWSLCPYWLCSSL